MNNCIYFSYSRPNVIFKTLKEAKRQATKDHKVFGKAEVAALPFKTGYSILVAKKTNNKWRTLDVTIRSIN